MKGGTPSDTVFSNDFESMDAHVQALRRLYFPRSGQGHSLAG